MVTCGVRRLKHSTADQIFGYYLPDENITFPLLAWVAGSWLCPGGRLLALPGWPAPGMHAWVCPGGRLLAYMPGSVQVAGSWRACLGLARWPAPGSASAWVAGSWRACLGLSRWPAPGSASAWVAGSWHACLGLSRWPAPGLGGQLLADLELSPMHTHHNSGGKAYILPYSDDF